MLDIQKTAIDGVLLLTPKRFADARGHFVETFNAERFAAAGVADVFVQDNCSLSVEKGTLRGLHFQSPPRAQAKLVRVVKGSIVDVAVDARKGSPTYGRHVRAVLTAANGEQMFIPAGFLHGFMTLEPMTEVAYKVTDYYSAAQDGAVLWSDPALAIDWGIDRAKAVVSEKDARAPCFTDFKSPF